MRHRRGEYDGDPGRNRVQGFAASGCGLAGAAIGAVWLPSAARGEPWTSMLPIGAAVGAAAGAVTGTSAVGFYLMIGGLERARAARRARPADETRRARASLAYRLALTGATMILVATFQPRPWAAFVWEWTAVAGLLIAAGIGTGVRAGRVGRGDGRTV